MEQSIEKFNILHIDTERHLGGGEKQLKLLIDNLDNNKFNSFIAIRKDSDVEEFFRGYKNIYPLRFSSGFDIFSIVKLKQLIKNSGINIVHAHTGMAANYAAILKFTTPIKTVATRRVSIPITNSIKKLKYRTFDRVVAVSKAIISQLSFLENIEWVESAVDTKFLNCPNREQALKMLGLNCGFRYVCNVAKIEPMKGQEYLIKAFGLLKKDFPYIKLLIAGKGNTKQLVELVNKLGLEKDVILLGFVEDTRFVYAASDICIVASLFGEGSSAAIKEALSCKIPIVSTNIGSAYYLVKNNGILINPKDISKLKESAEILLKKPIVVDFNPTEFSPKKMARKYERIYLDCIKN